MNVIGRHIGGCDRRQVWIGFDSYGNLLADSLFAKTKKHMRAAADRSGVRRQEVPSRISFVDFPLTESAVIITAMPPNPSGRIRVEVKAETAVT